MAFKNIFKKKQDIDTIVVGAEAAKPQKSVWAQMHRSSYFYVIAMIFLLVAVIFSNSSTSTLTSKWERVFKENLEVKASIEVEKKNLISLEALAEKVDEITEQQLYIDQAVPIDPRYDKMIVKIESMAIKSGVEVPESISWKVVPLGEISNEDIQELDVYGFSFEIKGFYRSFISFLESIRSSLRLMDVRSINGFKMDQDGIISATLVIWVYNIPME